jgi:ATPase subunit of ABC transporter with duplicated ATPase domains
LRLVTNLVRPALRHYPELEPESFKGPHVRLADPPLDESVARDVLLLLADVKRTAESFRFQQWTEMRDAEEFREGIDELMRAAESAQAFIEKKQARSIREQRRGSPVMTFARRVELVTQRVTDGDAYPFSLPAVEDIDKLMFHPQVTFLVGENGTGKSTLLGRRY